MTKSASNSAKTESARIAKARDGKTAAQRRAIRVAAGDLSYIPGIGRAEDLGPEALDGADALALALFHASQGGVVVPAPADVLLALSRRGWQVTRIHDAT